ncbi:MAG: GEVED domain-containing protein, partial [Bacteroidota bacterium]
SIVGEIYPYYTDSESVSASIGASNGQPALLTYSYKIVDYYEGTAYPNNPNWGSFTVSYATSASGPWTTIETVSPTNHIVSAQCATRTVNFTPPSGAIYLRLFVDVNEDEEDVDALLYFDNVTVGQGVCNGAPAATTALSSATSACTNESFTLSITPLSTVPGLTYQWQQSTDGVTYTNVATGGTATSYTATESQTTWFRAVVTCTNSGQSTNSTPVQVTSTGSVCYCDVDFFGDVEPITYVNFAGINNTTSNTVGGTPDVEDFTNLTPAEVTTGQSYPITLKGNTAGNYTNYFTVFIDFNHNGSFSDAGEKFNIGSVVNTNGNGTVQATGTIAIPAVALAGVTQMRVFKLFLVPTTDPCSAEEGEGYGQVEDYLINISTPCTTLAPVADAIQIVCTGSTIADLTATGNIIKWYAAATGGASLTAETALVNGTIYYAAQIPEGGCESTTRTAVTVQFSIIPPPTAANGTQVICGSGTVADLDVEGDGTIIWYAAATGGTALATPTALTNQATYYASQSVDGCESATRTAVTVQFSIIPPPPAENATQVFCESGTVANLEVDADGDVIWYTAATGGTVVNSNTALVDETTYYASQTVDGCESPTRTAVTAGIMVMSPPEGEATQTFTVEEGEGITIADIVIVADGSVIWYLTEADAIANTNAINTETYTIAFGQTVTLYVVQTIGECVSEPFAITVSTVLGVNGFTKGNFTYYPNPVKDVLNLNYTQGIDAVEVYNLLGQQILKEHVSQNEAHTDLSSLAAGTYLVKVYSGTEQATIKVVKQ